MKKILQYLFEHKTLDRQQAKDVLHNISKGVYNEHEVTAFMTVFLMRSITIAELQGFRDALLELCVPVDLNGHATIDIVGTGGDGKNTFNISTLSCFVVAGTGQKVAKHGNYGATSVSGASNVMEQLGYKFKSDKDRLKKEVEEANICFLHAPVFHPALKAVGPIRKTSASEPFSTCSGRWSILPLRNFNWLVSTISKWPAFTITCCNKRAMRLLSSTAWTAMTKYR